MAKTSAQGVIRDLFGKYVVPRVVDQSIMYIKSHDASISGSRPRFLSPSRTPGFTNLSERLTVPAGAHHQPSLSNR